MSTDSAIVKVKKDLRELVNIRCSLQKIDVGEGYTVGHWKKAFNGAKDAIENVVASAKEWLPPVEEKVPEDLNLIALKKETVFVDACQIVLQNLHTLHKTCRIKLFKWSEFQETIRQFKQKEILISFVGDSNVGKSTLLNGIIGNWYLPINEETETAVTVFIHFTQQKFSRTLTLKEIHKASEKAELRRGFMDKESEIIVQGSDLIRDSLEQINMHSLHSEKARISLQYSLFLPYSFMGCYSDLKYIFVDSPGCDEFDSANIDKILKDCRTISSAFIFVTSVDCYRRLESSKTLKDLYKRSPDIIRQNRLTIVVNKLDSAVLPKFGGTRMSPKDLVTKVRQFLCDKIFGCSERDLPDDLVIPVCSNWAFYGRSYQMNPYNPELEKAIEIEISRICAVVEEEKKKTISEYSSEDKAKFLEGQSKVVVLEKKLMSMAESSLLIWKGKLSSDIIHLLKTCKDSLEQGRIASQQTLEEHKQEIRKLFHVISKLKKFYCAVTNLRDKWKNSSVWKALSDSFEEDMKKHDNIQESLLESMSEKLELFRYITSDKISKGNYTPESLETDINAFLRDISLRINKRLSAMEFGSFISDTYSNEILFIHTTIVELKGKLLDALKQGQSAESSDGSTNIVQPKLTGPVLTITIDIPLGELPWFLSLLEAIKNFFIGKSLEETETYIRELGYDPLTDSDSLPSGNSGSNSTASNEQDHQSTSNGDPHNSEGFVKYKASQPEETTITSCENTGDTTAGLEYAGYSKSVLPEGRERSTYRKWTSDLETVKQKLKEEIESNIRNFFIKKETTIIQVYFEKYAMEAMSLLKRFDSTMKDEIQECQERLEMKLQELESTEKNYKVLESHLRVVNIMMNCISRFSPH